MAQEKSAALHWIALGATIAAGLSPASAMTAGSDVLLKESGGKLFFSERGGAFQELPLGGADAAALHALLRDGANASVDVGRGMVADGASGWHNGK